MTRHYKKQKRGLDDLEIRKRVNVFRAALSEVPELREAFEEFRSILSRFLKERDFMIDRVKISDFYADVLLAAMVEQKFLNFK